jgi:hypothetical protein
MSSSHVIPVLKMKKRILDADGAILYLKLNEIQ